MSRRTIAIGAALALVSWLMIVAASIVASAIVGHVLATRRTTPSGRSEETGHGA